MIVDFQELSSSSTEVGSKAYVLAMMAQHKLPVPAGMILSHRPKNDEDWKKIKAWWSQQGNAALAVRSSAFGEDSEEMSFAGQNQTFLNVTEFEKLKDAIVQCFQSVDREASQSYRQFFLGEKKDVPMNVVLQVMVKPAYAGVYFSVDPTKTEAGAMLEYVPGLGESLVSGKVNPFRSYRSDLKSEGPLSKAALESVFKLGTQAEEQLSQKIDMEWAIDSKSRVWFLQARPITSARSETRQKEIQQKELSRIQEEFAPDTCWDGQTFAEWTGQPSLLTYDIWKNAFSSSGAFDQALKELGYVGFLERDSLTETTILDRLFGKVYVNMSKMVPLYFGPIPYQISLQPRPKLRFQWHKMSFEKLLHAPASLWRMMRVGWNMSTHRRAWIDKSRKELLEFKHKMQRPQKAEFYQNWSDEEVLQLWSKEIANFSKTSLKWPLVLAILIEATHQSLGMTLKGILGEEKAREALRKWMGAGLKTASYEMNRYFLRATEVPLKREFFFSRFGHRGPGELDLSHPRWEELGDSAFGTRSLTSRSGSTLKHSHVDVESEIHNLKTFKDVVLVEEWNMLKTLLELREQWKMEILRPYAHIRYLSIELGKRFGLGNDIFQCTAQEIKALVSGEETLALLKSRVRTRKEELSAGQAVHLPDTLKMEDLESCLLGTDFSSASLRGLPLSPGSAHGTVRVVHDLEDVDFGDWPEDAILVAPSTDPGWTPLFTRCQGVIVERGGVLSHCAILAREIGLPSINLARATQALKNGDRIWMDGHHGGVKLDA